MKKILDDVANYTLKFLILGYMLTGLILVLVYLSREVF